MFDSVRDAVNRIESTAGLKAIARRVRSRIERLWYAGDAVTCNVCGESGRSWLKGREYGRCSSCRSATRTRTLYWYLLREEPGSTTRVLHFAPEPPLERQLRARYGSLYRTCDLRGSHVDVHADLQSLPFSDTSFDLVLCSHVLEHVFDDRKAMLELHRICGGRGRVLVMVPLARSGATREDLSPDLSSAERKRRFGEVDHLREYGHDIVARLGDAGFTVEAFEPGTVISSTTSRRHGLAPDQIIFVCRRS